MSSSSFAGFKPSSKSSGGSNNGGGAKSSSSSGRGSSCDSGVVGSGVVGSGGVGSSAGGSSGGMHAPPPPLPQTIAASRPRRPGPDRAPVHSSVSLVRHNSIRFRHDEPAWYEDSSFSGDSSRSGGSGSDGMEVMDLRPSSHHAVRHMETSSLVSLGSRSSGNSSIESSRSMTRVTNKGVEMTALRFDELPSGLFNVASSGGNVVNAAGDGGDASEGLVGGDGAAVAAGGVAPRGNMPTHWEEAGVDNEEGGGSGSGNGRRCVRRPAGSRRRSSLSLRISNNGKFLLGESEQAYKALVSLMSGSGSGGGNNDESNDNNNNGDASSRQGSRGSGSRSVGGESNRSGYWSELGDAAASVGSDGTASCASKMTETSPLTRRRLRRGMYARRCAQITVAVAALAALSGSAIYFGSTFGSDYLGRLLGARVGHELKEEEDQADRRLRDQQLPQEEDLAEVTTKNGGNGYFDGFSEHAGEGNYDSNTRQDIRITEDWIGWIDQDQENQRDVYPFNDEGRRALAPGLEGYQDNFAPQRN